MMRLAWLTDIHLNFVAHDRLQRFLKDVASAAPDAVLITGDIGEATDVVQFLQLIDDHWELPIYFVLGNHDYYFGSIQNVRQRVADLCRQRPNLNYLNDCSAIALTDQVALVGHDGWADARFGDYERSFVMMNDYKLIEELARHGKQQRWPLLQALGDEAAAHVHRHLSIAAERFPQVILATHVPPVREACWYNGQISDDEWAPHFTCKAVGDALLDVMASHPECRLTVLCGHTHSSGETRPRDNVHILTGGADYGSPQICRLLELDASGDRSPSAGS